MILRPHNPDGSPMSLRDYAARAAARREARRQRGLQLGLRRPAPEKAAAAPSRAHWIYRLDALWAFAVKLRAKLQHGNVCQVCGRRPVTVAYHIVPRGDYATRWLLDNGVGACAPCNRGEQLNRSRYQRKHVQLFGAALVERLEQLAATTTHFSVADLRAVAEDLQSFIASLTKPLTGAEGTC
jgi:hypothetical protein